MQISQIIFTFKLLNNELVLWYEKPTCMNHDIIEMLMDQIVEVKFEDWFIAVRYSFTSLDIIYWVDHIDNLVLWCQSICSHNIDQAPIPHAYFSKALLWGLSWQLSI